MAITGFSLNVKGLGSNTAKTTLRHFIRNFSLAPTFINLQEIKLRGKELEKLGDKIWKRAHFVHAATTNGVWAMKNLNFPGGCGGASLDLAISTGDAKHICDNGIMPKGHGAWVVLENFNSLLRVGTLSIYAPRQSSLDKTKLWALIRSSLIQHAMDMVWRF